MSHGSYWSCSRPRRSRDFNAEVASPSLDVLTTESRATVTVGNTLRRQEGARAGSFAYYCTTMAQYVNPRPDVLRQVFPTHVAASLERGERIQPQSFRDVYVLFADIIEYTTMCKTLPPLSAHKLLEDFYMVLDYCISLFPRLYKVETIGDCLMVIGGAPIHLVDTTSDMITFAMIIVEAVKRLVKNPATGEPIGIRVGIHVGDVVGGVFGLAMPRFTFTGDAVNTASRMQSLSDTNGVTVSLDVALAVARACSRTSTDESTEDTTGESSVVKATIKELKNVKRERVEMIPAGTSLPLGGIRLLSRGLENIKGKGLMQTFTLVQDEEQSTFLSRPTLSTNTTPRTLSFKHPKVAETAQLLSSPQFQAMCKLSSNKLSTSSFGSGKSSLSAESLANKDMSSRGEQEDTDQNQQLPSIASRISRILSSASLEALSSKLSWNPEAAVQLERQQKQKQQQQQQQAEDIRLALNPVALSILDGLEILLLCESSTQSKMLCHHLRPINSSWTMRVTSTYDELVGELVVGGFRCDLLLIDSTSLWVSSAKETGNDVLSLLQRKYPRFMKSVLTVILSEGMSISGREEEALNRGCDDCWAKPPEPPIVLQTRLIQAAITKFLSLSKGSSGTDESVSSVASALKVTSDSESALSDVVAQLTPRPQNDKQEGANNTDDDFFWPTDLLEIPVNVPHDQEKKKKARQKRGRGDSISSADSFSYSGRALSTVGRLLHTGLSNKWSRLSSVDMPLTILVVEDSPSQLKMIVRRLQSISAAWNVIGCADDTSAFSEIEALNFNVDLIFVDLHLGENSVNGAELTRKFRSRLSNNTVIIGMNRDRRTTEESFLSSGADAAWAKPLPNSKSTGSRLDALILARTGFATINATDK